MARVCGIDCDYIRACGSKVMTTPKPSRLAVRLDVLTREELLQLAADALDELPKSHHLRHRADALVAERKPLPAWCVDGVLLSPDLLPHLFESLSLRDCAAAAACSGWAAAWLALLRLRRYLNPVALHINLPKYIDPEGIITTQPTSVTTMPDGALCVSAGGRLLFLTAQGQPIPGGGAWEDLAKVEFDRSYCVLQHDDALLVADTFDQNVRRLRLRDGLELARSPKLIRPYELAISGDLLFVPTHEKISVLNVVTLELLYEFGERGFCAAIDCAVHHDVLYVVDQECHGMLQVFGLDGRPRSVVRGEFGAPTCISIRDDHIYLVEGRPDPDGEDYMERCEAGEGRRLLVLELDGTIRQKVLIPSGIQSLCLVGDEIWFPDSEVTVLHRLRFV